MLQALYCIAILCMATKNTIADGGAVVESAGQPAGSGCGERGMGTQESASGGGIPGPYDPLRKAVKYLDWALDGALVRDTFWLNAEARKRTLTARLQILQRYQLADKVLGITWGEFKAQLPRQNLVEIPLLARILRLPGKMLMKKYGREIGLAKALAKGLGKVEDDEEWREQV